MFALLAGLCWLAARLGRLMTAQAGGTQAAPAAGAGATGLLVRALPYLTVLIAAFAPLAAGIYLLTSLAWSLAERAFFWRSAAAPAVSGVPSGGTAVAVRKEPQARLSKLG